MSENTFACECEDCIDMMRDKKPWANTTANMLLHEANCGHLGGQSNCTCLAMTVSLGQVVTLGLTPVITRKVEVFPSDTPETLVGEEEE
jgi:hypothetical protein